MCLHWRWRLLNNRKLLSSWSKNTGSEQSSLVVEAVTAFLFSVNLILSDIFIYTQCAKNNLPRQTPVRDLTLFKVKGQIHLRSLLGNWGAQQRAATVGGLEVTRGVGWRVRGHGGGGLTTRDGELVDHERLLCDCVSAGRTERQPDAHRRDAVPQHIRAVQAMNRLSGLPAGWSCCGGGCTCACSGCTWTNSRRSYSRRRCCSSGPGCPSSSARRTPCPRRWPRPAGDDSEFWHLN